MKKVRKGLTTRFLRRMIKCVCIDQLRDKKIINPLHLFEEFYEGDG